MKESLKKIKNKIISLFIDLKNKAMPLVLKNKKISIVVLAIVIFVILLICITPFKKEIGNTSGNLENSGFSVSLGKWVYYLGYDEGSFDGIYKIKGNKKEKVIDDYGMYLNKDGRYIYYLDAQQDKIVRIKENGKSKEVVVEDVDKATITVKDNWIYYFDKSYFCRIKTNGENKKIISKKFIENYQIVGNYIYYSYINDGNYVIAKMRTNGEEVSKIDTEAGKTFFVKGNSIYYINEDYKDETYELYKVKINGKNKKKIADITGTENLNIINFTENEVFYVKINEDLETAIYKMDLKGKKELKVVDIKGYTTSINIQDNWIYYPDQNDYGDMQMFKVRINGNDKQAL